jgi:hypothetical protein
MLTLCRYFTIKRAHLKEFLGPEQGFPILFFAAAGGRERREMRGHLALSPVVSPGDGDSGKGLPPSALLLVPRTAKL